MSLFNKYKIGSQSNFRISLSDVCLHVESINSDSKILPEYSCLLMSPTNLWHQDPEEFRTDNSLEKTIFTFQVLIFFKYFN